MAALALLFLLILYLALAAKVTKWVNRRISSRFALAVALLFILAPSVDALVGRKVLEEKCATEGHPTIMRTVADVQGIGVNYGVFKDSPQYYGYEYVEGGFVYGSSSMLERAQSSSSTGEAVVTRGVQPQSRYLLSEGPRQDSYYYYRTRISVFDRATQEELAAFTWIAFRGGWAERIPMSFSGAGPGSAAECGERKDKELKTLAMLHETLKPRGKH